ncbi:unnamed protein product, partial [Iphiclides podalirius]
MQFKFGGSAENIDFTTLVFLSRSVAIALSIASKVHHLSIKTYLFPCSEFLVELHRYYAPKLNDNATRAKVSRCRKDGEESVSRFCKALILQHLI